MFFKKRKGGVELVSIIILAVILGAATISIAVGLSKNAKNTAEGGLSANNSHLSALYQSLEDDLSDISSPGGGEIEYGTAGSAQVLEGYTIATTVGLIEGAMRRNDLIDAKLTTQNASYSIPEGYHNGNGKVTANITNLEPANIKKGVYVGGVVGNYNGTYSFSPIAGGPLSYTIRTPNGYHGGTQNYSAVCQLKGGYRLSASIQSAGSSTYKYLNILVNGVSQGSVSVRRVDGVNESKTLRKDVNLEVGDIVTFRWSVSSYGEYSMGDALISYTFSELPDVFADL